MTVNRDLFGYAEIHYPERPGFSNRTTSRAAADNIEPHVSKLGAIVLDFIASHGGATCCEIEQATKLSHQTASARVRELFLRGRIVQTDARRPTTSGRMAIVWQTK